MANLLILLADLWADVDPILKQYRAEVKQLRESIEIGDVTDSMHALHDRLVSARRAQDRVEAIVSELGLIRSRLRRLVADLTAVYEDKFAENVVNDRIGEYSSAKAQDARYQAGAFAELRNLRKAKQMLADVEEVYDYANFRYRGLDGARRDLDARIRFLNFESNLER